MPEKFDKGYACFNDFSHMRPNDPPPIVVKDGRVYCQLNGYVVIPLEKFCRMQGTVLPAETAQQIEAKRIEIEMSGTAEEVELELSNNNRTT